MHFTRERGNMLFAPAGMQGAGGRGPVIVVAASVALSYSTTFSATENPLSESGKWGSVLNRTDFQSTGGFAVGKQTGLVGFDDSIMLLTFGTWTDTEIVTTIHKNGTVNNFCEIEHIHRGDASTGKYIEINLAHDGGYCNAYLAMGPIGSASDFEDLAPAPGGIQFTVSGGVHDGDLFRTRITGSGGSTVITAEINYNDSNGWHLIATWSGGQSVTVPSHTVPASGRPGIGAFISNGGGPMANYNITDFTATGL